MPSPAAPYKLAQEGALRASPALALAMELAIPRLYTEVPAGAPLPYGVLGNDQIILDTSGCAVEAEITSTLTWWSRKSTLDKGAQARAMGAAIIDAVGGELTVAGWDVDDWEVQSESYSTDPDQSTKGVLVVRHLLTQQLGSGVAPSAGTFRVTTDGAFRITTAGASRITAP